MSTYLRDQLLGSQIRQATAINAYIEQEYRNVDRAIRDCRFGSEHGDRIYTLHQIVVRSLVWLVIAVGLLVDEFERLWMALYRAVNDRDFDRIETYVLQILADRDRLTRSRAEYVVGVGMIAYAAKGDARGAEAFWQRYASEWQGERAESFIYQFLLQSARMRRGRVRG